MFERARGDVAGLLERASRELSAVAGRIGSELEELVDRTNSEVSTAAGRISSEVESLAERARDEVTDAAGRVSSGLGDASKKTRRRTRRAGRRLHRKAKRTATTTREQVEDGLEIARQEGVDAVRGKPASTRGRHGGRRGRDRRGRRPTEAVERPCAQTELTRGRPRRPRSVFVLQRPATGAEALAFERPALSMRALDQLVEVHGEERWITGRQSP